MTTFMPSFGPWHQNVAEVTRKGPVAMVRDPSILPAAKKNTHCIKHIDSHVEYIYIYIYTSNTIVYIYICTHLWSIGCTCVYIYNIISIQHISMDPFGVDLLIKYLDL